jgi:hypothetical protein
MLLRKWRKKKLQTPEPTAEPIFAEASFEIPLAVPDYNSASRLEAQFILQHSKNTVVSCKAKKSKKSGSTKYRSPFSVLSTVDCETSSLKIPKPNTELGDVPVPPSTCWRIRYLGHNGS